jgi:hypothetical protein
VSVLAPKELTLEEKRITDRKKREARTAEKRERECAIAAEIVSVVALRNSGLMNAIIRNNEKMKETSTTELDKRHVFRSGKDTE